jgi:hypothetical protein
MFHHLSDFFEVFISKPAFRNVIILTKPATFEHDDMHNLPLL